jgi:hypothetical protein
MKKTEKKWKNMSIVIVKIVMKKKKIKKIHNKFNNKKVNKYNWKILQKWDAILIQMILSDKFIISRKSK